MTDSLDLASLDEWLICASLSADDKYALACNVESIITTGWSVFLDEETDRPLIDAGLMREIRTASGDDIPTVLLTGAGFRTAQLLGLLSPDFRWASLGSQRHSDLRENRTYCESAGVKLRTYSMEDLYHVLTGQ